jgi:hypothetical protein
VRAMILSSAEKYNDILLRRPCKAFLHPARVDRRIGEAQH